ncbi:MAG: FecR domain-containing protein, partial [Planctomycetota bacterium]
RLTTRLKNDAGFRKAFASELAMHGQLKAVQSGEPRWLKLEDELGSDLRDDLNLSEFETRVMDALDEDTTPWQSHVPHDRWRLVVASTAAFIVATAFFWVESPHSFRSVSNRYSKAAMLAASIDGRSAEQASEAKPDAIAVLNQSVDARWKGATQPRVGQSLNAGTFSLEHGTVQIDFLAGVRLLLRAPADVELRSATEVLLREGAASCFVSELGRGFRIVTNQMDVVDQGTAFSMEVNEQDRAEIHVLEGSVEIRTPGQAPFRLEEHQAVRMNDNGPESVSYAPDQFPMMSDMRTQKRRGAKVRLDQWKRHTEQWSADPSVILHYTFEEDTPNALELKNVAKSPQATDGVVIGCQWVDGRWPGKHALAYRHANDRVLFQVPRTVEGLTFALWARVDALTQRTTSLLMTESLARRRPFAAPDAKSISSAIERREKSNIESVRWELTQPNETVMFSIGRIEDQDLRYDALSVRHPSTQSNKWGQWACYGVTCDVNRGEVIHYFNGHSIGIRRFQNDTPLILDFMELGNFGTTPRELEESGESSQRRFYGAMDELLIANRAFTKEEMNAFWANGKP